jgi:hypothetical protein
MAIKTYYVSKKLLFYFSKAFICLVSHHSFKKVISANYLNHLLLLLLQMANNKLIANYKYFVWKSKYYFIYIFATFITCYFIFRFIFRGDKHVTCGKKTIFYCCKTCDCPFYRRKKLFVFLGIMCL